MNIKHSKYKNTGILFELLVRQITADTLSGKDSKATNILKKYFVKTELGREYKLYENAMALAMPQATYKGCNVHSVRAWSLASSKNCYL